MKHGAAGALLAIAMAGWPIGAGAQMPWSVPEDAKPVKTAQAAEAPAQNPTAATPAAPSEDLPWLTDTKPTAPPAATPANPSAAATAVPAPGTPAAKPDAKKGSKVAQKCEEQQEEGCRTMKSCAWVAAMPKGDGTVTPARCAERKVFAPEKEKKKKPAVAAKPKPKPAETTSTQESSSPEASKQTAGEPNPEAAKPAATVEEPKPEPKEEKPAATVVAPPPAEAPAPPAEKAAEPAPQPTKPEALTIPARPAVPFLATDENKAAAGSTNEPPRAEAPATPPPAVADEKTASNADSGANAPISIPGLVISE